MNPLFSGHEFNLKDDVINSFNVKILFRILQFDFLKGIMLWL